MMATKTLFGCSSLTCVLIPSSVENIGQCAFRDCESLQQITIPSSAVSIEKNAFDGCKALTKINLPQALTSIGECAFYSCSSLEEVLIPSSVTTINSYVFYGCSSLKQILIHSSVKFIEKASFKECLSLEQIIFEEPSSLESISKSAFSKCKSLKQLNIPLTIKSIGDKSFRDCISLLQIRLPCHINNIGENAFKGCSRAEKHFYHSNNFPITINSTSSRLYGSGIYFAGSQHTVHSNFIRKEDEIKIHVGYSKMYNQFQQLNYDKITLFEPNEICHFFYSFRIICKIGQCAFYQTYLYEDTKTGFRYAANILYQNLEYYPKELRNKAISFLTKMKQIDHPSIMKCIDFKEYGYDENHYSTFLTEYVKHETLQSVIQNGGQNSEGRSMNDTEKLKIIYGIASAISYLHSHEILHFDLKPSNILLDENFHPKLINCGMKPIFRTIKEMMRIKDFSFYCSPEFYIDNKYSKSSDVYSFALIVYEILTNQSLFEKTSFFDHIENINKGVHPPYNSKIPKPIWNIITKCWSSKPEERLSFNEILNELENDQILLNINEQEFKKFVESNKFIQDGHNSSGGESKNDYNESQEKNENQSNENDKNIQKTLTKPKRKRKESGVGDGGGGGEEEEEEEENNKNEIKIINEEEEENEIIKDLTKEKINKICLELYEKKYEIDRGGFGIVYKIIKKMIENTNNNNINNDDDDELKTFAAKESILNILDRDINDKLVKSFLNEVKNHSKLLYSSIVKFIGYSPNNFENDKTKPTIIMDYCENGSLENEIKKLRDKKNDFLMDDSYEEDEITYLNNTQKLKIIYGIAEAMKQLHSLNIIHRDLKPQNVLLDKNFHPKLTDFGLSISESEIANETFNKWEGTDPYIAPEIWSNYQYSKFNDVYAFAILVYELMTDQILFEDLNSYQIAYQIAEKNYRPSAISIPQSF